MNVVALTDDDRLVLVRQFRYGIDDFSLEIPGGMIDPGEDPVAAAQRELREETGYAGGPAHLLGRVHPNPAIQNNRCHLVLVENAQLQGAPAWDHDEEIEVSTAPVSDVLTWARTGRITHSLVLCALSFFEHWPSRAEVTPLGPRPRSGCCGAHRPASGPRRAGGLAVGLGIAQHLPRRGPFGPSGVTSASPGPARFDFA